MVPKEKYQKTIDYDLAKCHIIEVPSYDPSKRTSREWYFPRHPIVNPRKPAKVRRVLNGASKCQKQSLNSALLSGADQLQNLLHALVRFGEFPFAVSADIEARFLQVHVLPADHPSLMRFLWREVPANEIVVYQYTRHIFGSKDSPLCANYALRREASDNVTSFRDETLAVERQFFMYLNIEIHPNSLKTPQELLERSQALKRFLSQGGFKLTKFVSNAEELPDELNENTEPNKKQNETRGLSDILCISSHVLGLKWDN